jgi:hypothetical protein
MLEDLSEVLIHSKLVSVAVIGQYFVIGSKDPQN